MKVGALIFLGVASFIAQSALAQAPTATTTPLVSVDSLLAAGYEVKAVTVLSDTAIKELWPNQTSQTELAITLQKGNSLAVCALSTLGWVTMANSSMTNAVVCSKR
jgi:hypothetical protein